LSARTQRLIVVAAICGGITLLLMALESWHGKVFQPLQSLEYLTQNLRANFASKTPIDPRLVLIGVDRPAYEESDFTSEDLRVDPNLRLMERPWPWSRAVWADAIQRLADAGAKVIALDFVFPSQGDGDDALREALNKYRDQVVIGCNISDLKSDRGVAMSLQLPSVSVLETTNNLSPVLDDRVGFVNIWRDSEDDVLRRARYHMDARQSGYLLPPGVVAESLESRILLKFGHPELIPADTEPVYFRYTARPGGGYRVRAIGDVFSAHGWSRNYDNGAFFRGKIVLIGPTADLFQDAHRTPFLTKEVGRFEYSSEMLGPEIHLNILGAALHGAFLREVQPGGRLVITALAGLLASVLSFLARRPLPRFLALLLVGIGYLFLARELYDLANLIIPVASPMLVLLASGVGVLGYDYFRELFERQRTRRTLERYVSRNLVKELLDNPSTYYNSLGGRREKITVLFCDVRDFTALTEAAESEQELLHQLNEYFQEMVGHVFSFKGTLDKFIGDALMATWGNVVTASEGPERDAQNAVATALAMRRSLPLLNATWKKRGLPSLAFGIGINFGEAIVGNLGSTEKMDLTAVGDTVNLASRLEGLTKRYHLDLLLGETVAPLVRDRFLLRTVDLVVPRGKSYPVEIFTVIGERGSAIDPQIKDWLDKHEEAVRLYRRAAFAEALSLFDGCMAVRSDDFLCSLYRQSCVNLLKNPPGDGWAPGSLVATS
jgi:adenylate cyclase